MLFRSTLREIRTSKARYLAIFAIVALGVGFFAGLRICRADMTKTAGDYLSGHGMYDYMIVTSYGVDDESVGIAEAEKGVSAAEGSVQIDIMASKPDGNETALRAISLPDQINTLSLVSGRMPEGPDECVADDHSMEGSGFSVGDTIVLSENNEESRLVSFRSREFKVVGTVDSPIFLDYQRGSTDIGNGSLSYYFYIDRSAFDIDYYTRLYLKLDGDEEFFTDEKSEKTEAAEEQMKDLAGRILDARRDSVIKEFSSAAGDPVVSLMGGFMLPVYRIEKEELLKKLDSIDAELEKTDGGRRKLLSEERDETFRKLVEIENKIADAGMALDYAQQGLDDQESGDAYAVSVYKDPGFSSFENSSDIVSNIAKVFPAFFFLIAALVCMTTMSRMIDEQRAQIGVLMALGYSNAAIVGKYMFYSCSSSLLGAVTGFFIGCRVFPFVIWRAYGIMFDFCDKLEYIFDPWLGLVSVAAALICCAGATWMSISRDFAVPPSELIRPRTPPAGRRIFLERITPLWERISFLYKVSFRNVFRDRKRFLMMVAGVSGCTALLIAGMGIGTSVAGIADHQFDEISLFDYRVIFSRDMDESLQKDFTGYMQKESGTGPQNIRFIHQDDITLLQGEDESAITCIAADGEGFEDFIDMHQGDSPVGFPDEGEAVIVRNISRDHGLSVGDSIRIRAGDREGELRVSGICDNYMYDTVYMSKETYEKAFGRKPEIRSAIVNLSLPGDPGDAESSGADSGEAVRESAKDAANYRYSNAVVVNLDIRESVSKMMQSLDLVTYVIILSAAMLAFVVIYNLTNINITERIREIATIKVLGFHQNEVAQYVFRENIFMTAIAAAVGIPLGKWLLGFAFDKISMKMLYFEPILTFGDILKAVALTFVFSALVNLSMQKRLRDVSMTESLKSVE